MLTEKILGLGRELRRHHIPVSYSQIEAALQAVSCVGLERENLFQALACTLITDRTDMHLFRMLFPLYFPPRAPDRPPREESGTSLEPEESGDGSERVEHTESSGLLFEQSTSPVLRGPPHLLLIRAIKEGDYDLLLSLAHQGVKGLGMLTAHDRERLTSLVKMAKDSIGWDQAMQALFWKHFGRWD